MLLLLLRLKECVVGGCGWGWGGSGTAVLPVAAKDSLFCLAQGKHISLKDWLEGRGRWRTTEKKKVSRHLLKKKKEVTVYVPHRHTRRTFVEMKLDFF